MRATILTTLITFTVAIVVLACAQLAFADDELRYPADLAWRLVTEKEIREATKCSQVLGKAQSHADSLFPQPELVFSEIAPLKNTHAITVQPKTKWSIAPFPSIAPPPPSDIPAEIKASLEAREQRLQAKRPKPDGFQDIEVLGEEVPAATLRPRAQQVSDQFFAPEAVLPIPFSLRRYHTKSYGFFQIALYGGVSSLLAERDFNTLKAAAPNRTMLSALAGDAFLTYLAPPEASAAPQAQSTETHNDVAETKSTPAFGDIKPTGAARPDLLDKGLLLASKAPSFQQIPVDELPKEFADAVRVHLGVYKEMPGSVKQADSQDEHTNPDNDVTGVVQSLGLGAGIGLPNNNQNLENNPFAVPAKPQEDGLTVLVVCYPEKAIICELAMDNRLGDLPSLMQIAFLVQTRLLYRW